MNKDQNEVAELPNISYPPPAHLPARGKVNKRRDHPCVCRHRKASNVASNITKPRSVWKNSDFSTLRQKFQSAFSRAIAVRTRVLSRMLTMSEWRQLRDAVRKQCTPIKTDSTSKSLRALTKRVNQLENVTPDGPQKLADSIQMFSDQIQILRAQAQQLMLENDALLETCPHFRNKKILQLTSPQLCKATLDIPSFGIIFFELRDRPYHLACDKCLERRIDCLFEWTGYHLKGTSQFDFETRPFNTKTLDGDAKRLLSKDFHPLRVQEIWSQIINLKYKDYI